MWAFILKWALIVFIGYMAISCVKIVSQSRVYVVTMFGRYRRCLRSGLNIMLPWPIEAVYRNISLQIHTRELEFSAITVDQAEVDFSATLMYSVMDDKEDTIKKATFTFSSQRDFQAALDNMVEGEARTIIASKTQQETLGIREQLSDDVMEKLETQLGGWGYKIHDLRITNLEFGEEVTASMEKVVAASNKRKAAENEGDAIRIQLEKQAQAEGTALTIKATAEKEAWKLRGEGMATFREEISKGIAASADNLKEKGIDPSVLTQFAYMETLKDIAENGKGKIIFLDSGAGGAKRMGYEISSLLMSDKENEEEPEKKVINIDNDKKAKNDKTGPTVELEQLMKGM